LTVWSSTSANTGLGADGLGYSKTTGIADHFETQCIPYTGTALSGTAFAGHVGADSTNPAHSYADFTINAPAGTKSLLISFGYGYDEDGSWTGPNSCGALVAEIQGFGAVPEPGTLALAATGLIGLLAYAWRKQK
jgi:hypothetical protein